MLISISNKFFSHKQILGRYIRNILGLVYKVIKPINKFYYFLSYACLSSSLVKKYTSHYEVNSVLQVTHCLFSHKDYWIKNAKPRRQTDLKANIHYGPLDEKRGYPLPLHEAGDY